MIRFGLLTLVASNLAFASATPFDTIHLVDGSPLEGVTIEEETITSVTYKKGSQLDSIPSDRVDRVVFDRLPDELDEAEAFVRDGDIAGGLDAMSEYLSAIIDGQRERKEWAPPYAAKRVIDLSRAVGDLAGVEEIATWLLKTHPESRYVPEAYLTMADAQARMGRREQANETLQKLQSLVAERGLPARWKIECDLALILTDDTLRGDARRARLDEIVTVAGSDYPGARNRAKLAQGESLVLEAFESSGDRAPLLKRAKALFDEIVEAEYVSEEVLAGVYTGLGDCLFYGKGDDQARYLEAGMKYMRVVVLYREHSRYVAKAMFYAGRCFDQLDDVDHKAKARRLYRSVIVEFPESNWAQEAQNFI